MRRGSKLNRLMDYWLGTPLLNLLATFHRKHSHPAKINRIGVLCSPALGDTLLFSGPLQDVRKAFPQAHLTHICMAQNLAAAEIIPGADERLVISLTSPGATVAAIQALKLDVLLDFSSWQRLTAFYALRSGAKFTAGFRTPGMHRSRGYDLVVDHTNTRHELENFRALLGAFVSAPKVSEPAVVVEPSLTPFAEEHDIVVFHPWASGQNSHLREWAEANWLALAQQLAGAQTLFVVTGALGDTPRMTPFVTALRAAGLRAEPFTSPDGFRSLTALLLHTKLTVSVNTGVMHLAAVAGAPTISLNGPTAEHRWGARGARIRNVQPADGSGGYLHLGFEFGKQPADIIDRITVGQVVAAAKELR